MALEVGPSGRLVFVSDVHLTGGGPVADFGATDELVELLDDLGRHDGDVLLMLGGDILDLLQAGGTPVEAVGRVLAGADARAVAAAVARIAGRTGGTVVYLVGNHDSALAWDAEARSQVGEAFGVDRFALHAQVEVHCPDGRTVTVLAEHGHAMDVYNRHTDPYDPLDTPAGDHVVQEVVNRFDLMAPERPDLRLDQIDNVRPSAAVPVWLVSNFFYRFLRRMLRRFALPLVGVFILLHVPVVTLVLHDLHGRSEEVARMASRAFVWLFAVVLVDVALFVVLAAFLGRSLRDAAAVYGGTPDDDATDLANRAAAMGELLTVRDPDASVLLAGHTHRAALVPGGRGRVVADSGCWIQALIPVRTWLALPPVFVPAYPCTWVEVLPAVGGAEVSLWERPLAAPGRLSVVERIVMRGRPAPSKPAPARKVVSARALPRPGPLRPDWTPGAAAAGASEDPLGSQRWSGLPAAADPRSGDRSD
ncbi:MAG TPA: metallophosphoesterase [Mycobacteriales bacterium]|nr:metallophosphoesterase [Mycobacteriales bacterium]